MNIYLKFCGGCNPRYDRMEFASRVEEAFPEHSFQRNYQEPDISLVICGCGAACADKTDAAAPYGICTVWSCDSFEQACAFINEAASDAGERDLRSLK